MPGNIFLVLSAISTIICRVQLKTSSEHLSEVILKAWSSRCRPKRMWSRLPVLVGFGWWLIASLCACVNVSQEVNCQDRETWTPHSHGNRAKKHLSSNPYWGYFIVGKENSKSGSLLQQLGIFFRESFGVLRGKDSSPPWQVWTASFVVACMAASRAL